MIVKGKMVSFNTADLEQEKKSMGKVKRSRKYYSGGKTGGLVLFSLEKTQLVGTVWQKKPYPTLPHHAEYSGRSRAGIYFIWYK